MNYLIGLDIGTSSVKGILMTQDGKIEKTAHVPFLYTKTADGGVEIDADKYVDCCCSAIKELACGAVNGEVKGICASSASGNLLLLDKQMNPTTPIYSWQDQRTTNEPEEFLKDIDMDQLYAKIGWPFLWNCFPLALLCYVKKHSPEKLNHCGMVCMSTEYLYYKLTGKWGISPSAGTPFYMIDQVKGDYIPEFMDIFGITKDNLPPIMPCGTKLGEITTEVSEKCGLRAGVPVVLGSFDHPSAARGVGVFNEGEMMLSCGTSWVGFFPLKDREKAISAKILVDPFLSEKGGAWGSMVSVTSLAERIKLYTDYFISKKPDSYKELAALAKESVSGANGLNLCLMEDPDDQMVSGHSKEDVARAIMEGAVALLKNKLDELKAIGISPKSAVMVGGPSENPLYSKIIEEMCGITVEVIHGANAGAVGAAKLAGIGAGIYKDEQDANDVCNRKE